MDQFLTGVALSGLIFLVLGGYYLFALIIRLLADNDILVTYPIETTAKAVVRNGQFSSFIMASHGTDFASTADSSLPEEDRWEVISVPNQPTRRHLPLLANIRWVGLPPFKDIYRYRFSWTSLEEKQLPGGKVSKEKVYTDKQIDYIFLRYDVYIAEMIEAECADNIPLNATVLVGGKIINPYKALFKVERWLESTLNLVVSRMRSFFGTHTYADLRQIQEAMQAGSGPTHELSVYFQEQLAEIRDKWGFEVTFIQIYSISPGSQLAQDFIQATTQKYVAQQQADARVEEGRGLVGRDKPHFEAMAAIPGGFDMYKWDSIRQSGLTTYVESGGAIPSIQVGGQGPRPKPTEPSPDDQSRPTNSSP